ncbi:MAG: hypothetical protein ISS35_00320 [Kiritimatiellae bacterium]|nr:hypothetical protein [Kiritimatiellia bacterium]
MKKVLLIVVIAIMALGIVEGTATAADPAAAGLLSVVLPGCGEWYNGGWKGSFPFVECIAGWICPCVQVTSMMDAVNGNAERDALRIDFWSAPR